MFDTDAYIKTFFYKNKGKVFLTLVVYIVDSILTIAVSWYLQVLFDMITHPSRNGNNLMNLINLFLILILIMILITIVKYFAYPGFLKQAMMQYRKQAFKDLLSKQIMFFSSKNSATYLSAFTNDMIAIQDKYLKNIFNFIQLLILLVGALSLMFFYNVSLTLIAIGLSILPMLSSVLLGGRLAEKEKIVSKTNETYVSSLKDILSGFPTIKTFKAEKDIHYQFDKINETLENNKKQANQMSELIMGLGVLTSVIAQIGVMLVGAYFILDGTSQITVGMVIAFTNLMNLVVEPLAEIPRILAERKAAKKLIHKLKINLMDNYNETGEIKLEKKTLPPLIQFNNVSYTHSDGNLGLADVSLTLKPGKIYGIVGGSGAGKSTLLNMLMKSHQTYTGEILVDQQDLKQITSGSLYNSFSLIQQEVFIFNTTIENNVTLFKPFPKEKIKRALYLSGLSKLIEQKGVAYKVGENGKNLSGGERQRIAIARALIRDNSVMLIDEVTSALDNLTAQHINQTILALENTTRIVVTHHLDEKILSNFDEIYVMKKGKVVEVGQFEKLMAQKGYFYSLFMVEN